MSSAPTESEEAKNINDGGPAFPHDGQHNYTGGMTLRDYMAIHSSQPGVAEILTAAGLGEMSGTDFYSWWARLTNEERFALTSKVRYQQADAMLKAREAA